MTSPSLWRPKFQPTTALVGFMLNKVSLRQIVSEHSSLPLPVPFRTSLSTISCISHRRDKNSAFGRVVSGFRCGAYEIFALTGYYGELIGS